MFMCTKPHPLTSMFVYPRVMQRHRGSSDPSIYSPTPSLRISFPTHTFIIRKVPIPSEKHPPSHCFSPPPPISLAHSAHDPLTNKLLPPISSGFPTPMTSNTVGATSPKTPSSPLSRLQPLGAFAITNGTRLVVWLVLGFPSALSISSALP